MKVRINLTKRRRRRRRRRRRKESSVKLSSMCVPYNERSNRGVYLVWQPINTLLYTILLCRIRAKLLTATTEQNGREGEAQRQRTERERERKSKCCSHHPSYRLQIFFKAYFGLSYPSCHREFFFSFFLSLSLLVISLYSKGSKKKRKSSANDPAAKCTQQSLPCMMFSFTTTTAASRNISSGIECLCNSISRKSILIFHCHYILARECVDVDDQIISAYLFLSAHKKKRARNEKKKKKRKVPDRCHRSFSLFLQTNIHLNRETDYITY